MGRVVGRPPAVRGAGGAPVVFPGGGQSSAPATWSPGIPQGFPGVGAGTGPDVWPPSQRMLAPIHHYGLVMGGH